MPTTPPPPHDGERSAPPVPYDTELSAVLDGLGALLDRFPTIRPAGDSFEWRATLNLRGPQVLPVIW